MANLIFSTFLKKHDQKCIDCSLNQNRRNTGKTKFISDPGAFHEYYSYFVR